MSLARSACWVQRGVISPLYTHQCAWCGTKLPHGAVFAEPDEAHRTSHGICTRCRVRVVMSEIEAKPTPRKPGLRTERRLA